MNWIHNKNETLKGPHYAIIEFGSITIPGDERSRTNPGHGYPEHTKDTCEYIAFTDKAEWEAEVQNRMTSLYGRKDNFIAVKVIPATVQTQIHVKIDEGRTL